MQLLVLEMPAEYNCLTPKEIEDFQEGVHDVVNAGGLLCLPPGVTLTEIQVEEDAAQIQAQTQAQIAASEAEDPMLPTSDIERLQQQHEESQEKARILGMNGRITRSPIPKQQP